MKAATVALVIRFNGKSPTLIDFLSDDREIHLLDAGYDGGDVDPLKRVYEHRAQSTREEDEFGDYVEELLSQPFLRSEIREHGVQWLKSKIRIEQYQQNESDAAKIIAEYAYKVYRDDPSRTDFFLEGPATRVRIRVFVIPDEEAAPTRKVA
jgi:hypothetical protein